MTFIPGDASPWDLDDLSVNRGIVNRGNLISPPATNVTYATNGAGVLTGNYIYLVTYLSMLNGQEVETSPWTGQPTPLSTSSNQIRVTLPAAPAGVTGRKLYRSIAGGSATDRAVFYLNTVAGNGATTYDDNAADGTLGAPPSWTSANRGFLSDGISPIPIMRAGDQSTTLGQQAGGPTPSYATVAIGFRAGASMAGGTRNTMVGLYAGENLTNARENTLIGTHAGNATVTGTGNTVVGYNTGTTRPYGNYNVVVGCEAMGGTGTNAYGTFNCAIGFNALKFASTGINRAVGLGPYAGNNADGDAQIYVDNRDRTSAALGKTDSPIYIVTNATANLNTIDMNGMVTVGRRTTVANLPAVSGNAGRHLTVTDGSVAYTSANVGSTVAGGGSNVVPVFCNGTNWVIG